MALRLRLTEGFCKLFNICLIFIFVSIGIPSTAQNLIVNGSMTCGITRSDTVAPGWYKYPNQPAYLNTPDINDSAGIAHCDPGWEWCCGTLVASPDGGTWQNVWTQENFAQTISGLTIGKIYYFRYYYASQGLDNGVGLLPGQKAGQSVSQPYAPDVTIIGATGYSNPSSGKLFEWYTYSGSLVATEDSITIICSEGKFDGYIAYDGFYLGTTPPENFFEIKSPASVTLCGGGNASFTVPFTAGISYQWQSGLGYNWSDVLDTGGVSGSQTNTLIIPNVTYSLNQMQYRCRLTSSCCTVLSTPATLQVDSLPVPVLKINSAVPDICGLNSIVVSTDSFYLDYLWSDHSINQNLTVTKPGTYWVEVTDSNNCTGRDSIQIYPCEKLVVPNAFTPNGDGINDVFKPTVFGVAINYTMTIYNRWGQMIFKSSDPGNGWDGTISGKPQPTGTYVWDCQYKLMGNKPDKKKGTVILIR